MSAHTPGPLKRYDIEMVWGCVERIERASGGWVLHSAAMRYAAGLVSALQALVEQVDKSGAVDDHGHELRHLKALSEARQAITRATEATS